MAKIVIEKVGEKIHLSGWIGPRTPDMCKSVGGGRFVPKDKGGPCWAYPLDTAVCRRLREVFRQQLVIGPELNVWARAAFAAEKETLNIAIADTADLLQVPSLAPAVERATQSRTYQRVAAAFGRRVGSFGLGDEPGLGKTLSTLAAIVESTPPEGTQTHLILCPKVAVRLVWGNEIRQWLGGLAEVFEVKGTRAQREKMFTALARYTGPARHIFVVTNLEAARVKPTGKQPGVKLNWTNWRAAFPVDSAEWPQLFARRWDTVVVDESHRALIRKSNPTQIRAGLVLLGERTDRRVALSGTPLRGKPEQFWGTLNWLKPDLFTSYWNWIGRYFEIYSDGYSSHNIGQMLPGAADRMSKDLAGVWLRRTKAEVLRELPPKTYAGQYRISDDENSPLGVWLEMSATQRKQYEEFVADSSLTIDGEELIANGTLAEYTRQKQLASATHKLVNGVLTPTLDSPQFEWILEKLEELGIEPGRPDPEAGKIVIASQFTRLINTYAAGLREKGIRVHVLTGETSEKERERIVPDFQSENASAHVFMLNTMAGGVALTLDSADHLVLVDETSIPDDQLQVEDRVHRAGRMHNVTIYYLRVLDTIQEELAWITAARLSQTSYLLDGARGVQYARKLYEEAAKAA